MNNEQIEAAVIECNRFLNRVDELKARIEYNKTLPKNHQIYVDMGCAETGAIKRASMDLSRALVKLR